MKAYIERRCGALIPVLMLLALLATAFFLTAAGGDTTGGQAGAAGEQGHGAASPSRSSGVGVAYPSAAASATERPAPTGRPPPPASEEEADDQGPDEGMRRAEELIARRRNALRAGEGRWFQRTDLPPNASRRWVFAYDEAGRIEALASLEGQWAPVTADVARFLSESAISFRRPFRNGRIPLYGQETNLSCEAATLRMVLASYGIEVPEEELRALIPASDNPHEGFVGEYHGRFGGVDDYGVYAEPLVDVLAHYGLQARASYGMSYAELDRLVRRGERVIVWLTKWEEDEREGDVLRRDGRVVAEFHGHQHVAVVVGRDAAGRWVLNDPYPEGGPEPDEEKPGRLYTCSIIPNWESFRNPTDPTAWGRMALVVSGPRD